MHSRTRIALHGRVQQRARAGARDLARTWLLQCLHTVCSFLPSGARQPKQVSRFCANFMMPPEAAEGVATMMERVCAPVGVVEVGEAAWVHPCLHTRLPARSACHAAHRHCAAHARRPRPPHP